MPGMNKNLKMAMTVSGAIFTVIGGITPLFTAQGTVLKVSVALLIFGFLAIVIFLVMPVLMTRYRAVGALPQVEEVTSLGDRYAVKQATVGDIGGVAKQEKDAYPVPSDRIPEALLKEWYDANPTGFTVIKAVDDSLVGHLNILPLRPKTCQRLVAGDITEREIRGDSLFGSQEKASITCLHVESVVLRIPKPKSSFAASRALLSALPKIIERVAELNKVERIYAIAATGQGRDLLQALGFQMESEAARRKDRHDLYGCTWQTVAARVRALSRSGRRA